MNCLKHFDTCLDCEVTQLCRDVFVRRTDHSARLPAYLDAEQEDVFIEAYSDSQLEQVLGRNRSGQEISRDSVTSSTALGLGDSLPTREVPLPGGLQRGVQDGGRDLWQAVG
jgi:hypothetical protein